MKTDDDIRAALRRAAHSAEPSLGAFERTVERHSAGANRPPERSRSSRLAAAAVALIVAAAGIGFVVRAFDGGADRVAEPSPAPATALDGTSWVLSWIDGESVVRGVEDSWFTLQFRDGEFTADSGCNRFGGTYEIDETSLRTDVSSESETVSACARALSDRDQGVVIAALAGEIETAVFGASLILDAGAHRLELVQDPCSFLTHREVAAAVEGSVTSSGLVPPSGMKVPGTGPVCSYDVPTTPHSSVGVSVSTTTLQRFEAEAAADEANFMDITGVGERAYISGMGSIVIFEGDRTIRIGLQHGAGDDAVPVLEQLGRAAVEAPDPAPSPGAPSGDDIYAACGSVRFPELPPDSSSFVPFSSFDDLNLDVGEEQRFFAEFIDGYDWFLAREQRAVRDLFGELREGHGGDPPFAYATFELTDEGWTPRGWGQCSIELTAEGWGTASFVVDPEQPPHGETNDVQVLATERGCAGGEPPTGRDVRSLILDEDQESVSVVILVEPRGGDCPGNPAFPFQVPLGEPLGDREILDASTYPPGVRWPLPSSFPTAADALTAVDGAALRAQIDDVGWEAFTESSNDRIATWADQIGASAMSPTELSRAMDQLTRTLRDVGEPEFDGDSWLILRELMGRRIFLCGLLPAEHPYRGGEYCD
jgi:heat shock protein HslJ